MIGSKINNHLLVHTQTLKMFCLWIELVLLVVSVSISFNGLLSLISFENLIESDIVDVVEFAIKHHASDLTTKAMALIALLKLSSRFPSCSRGKCEPWNIYMHTMFRNSSSSWGAYFTGCFHAITDETNLVVLHKNVRLVE